MASSSEPNENERYLIWKDTLDTGKRAIQEGRVDALAALLESGCSLEYETSAHTAYGWFALHALECQSTTSLDVLLQHGWDINMPEAYNLPPLLGKVIRNGSELSNLDMGLVHWFLNHGPNPNAYASVYAITPLSEAVRYGRTLDLVKLLFEHGGLATEGDLIYYLLTTDGRENRSDFLQKFDFLVQRGAPVNEALFERFPHLKDVTMFSHTPLITVCAWGDTELVKRLLDAGADPQKSSMFHFMPLKVAEERGHGEVKKMLLDAIALLPRL